MTTAPPPWSSCHSAAVFLFMTVVTSGERRGTIWWRIWVEHPYIKKGALKSTSPNPAGNHVQASLSSVEADRRWNHSPVIGWRWGSTDTLCATCFNELARMSRISLWRIEGNPPNGHDRACATVRGLLTQAGTGQPRRNPAIPEAQPIPKLRLREGKAMAWNGAACKPNGGTLLLRKANCQRPAIVADTESICCRLQCLLGFRSHLALGGANLGQGVPNMRHLLHDLGAQAGCYALRSRLRGEGKCPLCPARLPLALDPLVVMAVRYT